MSVRALGVTTAVRSVALPTVPAIADFVPGYEATVWYGLSTPKNTPSEVIERLNHEINAILLHPKVKKQLDQMGVTGKGGSPEMFRTIVADETVKWGKVASFANIKPE
jgi:tripartite-type tricarboxylate transporter receptor subunit TctC